MLEASLVTSGPRKVFKVWRALLDVLSFNGWVYRKTGNYNEGSVVERIATISYAPHLPHFDNRKIKDIKTDLGI